MLKSECTERGNSEGKCSNNVATRRHKHATNRDHTMTTDTLHPTLSIDLDSLSRSADERMIELDNDAARWFKAETPTSAALELEECVNNQWSELELSRALANVAGIDEPVSRSMRDVLEELGAAQSEHMKSLDKAIIATAAIVGFDREDLMAGMGDGITYANESPLKSNPRRQTGHIWIDESDHAVYVSLGYSGISWLKGSHYQPAPVLKTPTSPPVSLVTFSANRPPTSSDPGKLGEKWRNVKTGEEYTSAGDYVHYYGLGRRNHRLLYEWLKTK